MAPSFEYWTIGEQAKSRGPVVGKVSLEEAGEWVMRCGDTGGASGGRESKADRRRIARGGNDF